MADLTSQAQVESYLKRSLTTLEAQTLADAIPAATKYIERVTGRQYEVSEESEDRYYDAPGGTREIFIDPAQEVTGVAYVDRQGVETAWVINEDLQIIPRGTKTPKSSLLFVFHPRHGTENIKVTGKFGEDAPADIILAATALVAEVLHNPKGLNSRTIEGYSESYGRVVEKIELVKQAIDSNTRVVY